MMMEFFKEIKFDLILFLLFITGIVFIYASYAWFQSSLDVKFDSIKIKAATDNNLSISLDGIDWGNSISISKENIIDNLNNSYPNHTNRWAGQLTTVSTVGMLESNEGKFSVFSNKSSFVRNDKNKFAITSVLNDESKSSTRSEYLAFDIFLKNGSNSPYSENLFIKNWDSIFSVKDMDNAFILRGVRFGMTYINSTPSSSNIITVQNMICPQNGCKQFIFEPDSTHTQNTIDFLKLNNVDVDVNRKMITYGIINEANRVNVWTGMDGSPFDIDYSIFSLQSTTTDLSQPIFQIPSGISKYRIYIWLEGQDADIIKFSSPGYKFNFNLSFEKER